MTDKLKQKLIDLGAATLADALIELAKLDNTADDVVQRMVATPTENEKRFKAKLVGLKRLTRFISWSEADQFARELQALLQDLQAGVDDPTIGAELVVAFYETDSTILNICDDSSGCVGDVYRYTAKELFFNYAKRCKDKHWLANLVLQLNHEDDYGVRDSLIDCAAEYLPEHNIRAMIALLQSKADGESEDYSRRHWLILIESLAKQINDAELFEKTRLASWGEISTAARVDIAKVYFDSGDAQTALSWLEPIPTEGAFKEYERDRLLLAIYERLGQTSNQAEIAWRIFRRYRSDDSLQALLAVIGEAQRDAVIAQETASILAEKTLSLFDAEFLVEIDRLDDAERYLLTRTDQLDGGFYGSLLPLAETMATQQRPLGATILYRALLDSVLRRARAKTYPHGVRYLKKLDRLAISITDWQQFDDHVTYTQQLHAAHGRKRSFWSRYRG